MDNLQLGYLIVVLMLVILYNCANKDTMLNQPYTVPNYANWYAKELISPMASFQCVYPTIPLVVNKTYSQT
jgi:hypothetical protein